MKTKTKTKPETKPETKNEETTVTTATVTAPKKSKTATTKEKTVTTATVTAPKKKTATAKKDAAKTKGQGRTRSKLVTAILDSLDRRRWVAASELVEQHGHLIGKEQALKVQAFRAPALNDAPERQRVARGRRVQVMLSCITLVQHSKIEQRGKGESKEYRLV